MSVVQYVQKRALLSLLVAFADVSIWPKDDMVGNFLRKEQ